MKKSLDDTWEPIETSPKDGTSILCFNGGGSGKKPFQAVDKWGNHGVGIGWNGFGKENPNHFPHTHWMPLPEGPET